MTTVIAHDSSLHASLTKDGYGLIPSFLTAGQMRELNDFFFATVAESGVEVPFFTTHWSSSKDYRRRINEYVSDQLKSDLTKHFAGFKSLFGYYLYKKAFARRRVYMHKDWTLIDEEEFVGYTLWIPLVDTTIENGCFQVVPGSHLVHYQVRGSNIPQDYPHVRESDFLAVPARAGDCIIFDHRLLHASPPNLSQQDRLSVGAIIVPQSAEGIHYFHIPDTGETHRYMVGDDFLVRSFYDYRREEPADYILRMITEANTKKQQA